MSFLTDEFIDHDGLSLEFANESSTIFTNHHQEETFESASIIKLPIMIYIFNHTTKEERQEQIQLSNIVGGSGVLQNMNTQNVSINDLIYLMIVVSDNTATNTLINHFGLHHINLFINETLHCENTELNRFMMDENAIAEGIQNITTANDMIKILRYITQHDDKQEMMDIMYNQHLNDKVSIYKSFYEESLSFYSKTGEYGNVVNDVGIIQHEGTLYYYCFLSNTNKPKKAIDFSHQFGSYIIQSILKI
ncbi:serine hydrolase [Mammaliicoccus fleurettii]|uniref:serine hydrolase n=1 Tax=unclassified Mammaliicoccus TaxID=2803851 RepID=UPI000E691867|nr:MULTISPECIES: serine hydrolase [unclassified Mammaliicoccus]RIL50128.1 serine hydrolase [Mammaliicoccus fleurettii]